MSYLPPWFTAILFVIIFGRSTEGLAQDRSTRIWVSLGLIENLQDTGDQPHYAFYPEIQLSGRLITLDKAAITLGGSLYWGYWSDGVSVLSNCADCITYAYDSHIVGARLSAALDALPFSPMLVGGVSMNLFHADYIGGAGVAGNKGEDFSDSFSTAEIGLRFEIPLEGRLSLGANVQQYIPLVSEDRPQPSRTGMGIGLTYAL